LVDKSKRLGSLRRDTVKLFFIASHVVKLEACIAPVSVQVALFGFYFRPQASACDRVHLDSSVIPE
jgi:hypothetical protein